MYDRLKRFLGSEKCTKWMMVAPELPDINECRQVIMGRVSGHKSDPICLTLSVDRLWRGR